MCWGCCPWGHLFLRRTVRIYREINRWTREERPARIVSVKADRLTVDAPGLGLGDFRRDTGIGCSQPRNGRSGALARSGVDWRGWRLTWESWDRWYVQSKGA